MATSAQPTRDALIDETRELAASGTADEALLRHVVERLAMQPDWDWVGIYLLRGETLELGPFVGEPTEHDRIRVGDGVCGTAVLEDANQRVDDVNELANYIACSIGTRSELVVLIRHEDAIVAQFDLDSDRPAAFTADDERFLEQLAPIVAAACARLVAS